MPTQATSLSAVPSGPPSPDRRARPAADPRTGGGPSLDLLVHVAAALSGHARRLRADGSPVPPLVEELTALLLECIRTRSGASAVDPAVGEAASPDPVPRLLLTKGEAAAQLGVSVRTVERLVAAGRLPAVHIEGACRIRVTDIAAYVEELRADIP